MIDFVEKLKKAKGFVCMQPVAEKDIEQTERQLGSKLSAEYSEYVKECGVACIYGHELTGIAKSKRLNVVTVTTERRNDGYIIEPDMYVVEEMHIDGIILLQNSKGEVFIAKYGVSPRKIADSLVEYLNL